MKLFNKIFKSNAKSNMNKNEELMLTDEQEINNSQVSQMNNENIENTSLPRYAQLTPSEAPAMQRSILSQPKPVFVALINNEELKEFFNKKYFSRGRHNGANFGSNAIMRIGKNAIVSEFKQCLYQMDGKRRSKITELKNHAASTKDAFKEFDGALKDQITFLEDECQIIQHQLTNCEEYQGWVEGPLRTYESGFLQGLACATRYRFN